MDFKNIFNKVKKGAETAAEVAVEKASEIAESAKFEIEIGKLKMDIKKIYTKLGEVTYESEEKGLEVDAEIKDMCREIKRKKDYIIELESQAELAKQGREIKKEEFVDTDEKPDFMKKEDE